MRRIVPPCPAPVPFEVAVLPCVPVPTGNIRPDDTDETAVESQPIIFELLVPAETVEPKHPGESLREYADRVQALGMTIAGACGGTLMILASSKPN